MNLINGVKKETFLFSDAEINQAIEDMKTDSDLNDTQREMASYVVLYCYKNKGTITKEEYDKDVKEYLYSISMDSKEVIDKIIDKNKEWFNSYYNDAVDGLITYFHAVQHARNNMMSLVRY